MCVSTENSSFTYSLSQILWQILKECSRIHWIIRISALRCLSLLFDALLHEYLRLYIGWQCGKELGIHFHQRIMGNLYGILLGTLTYALHTQMLLYHLLTHLTGQCGQE